MNRSLQYVRDSRRCAPFSVPVFISRLGVGLSLKRRYKCCEKMVDAIRRYQEWHALHTVSFSSLQAYLERRLAFGVHRLFFSGKKSIRYSYGSHVSLGDNRFGPFVMDGTRQIPRFDLLN